MYRAESSSLAIVKPTIAAVAPLKKYVDSAGNSTGAAVAAAAAAANNATTTVSTAFSPTLNVPEKIASVVGQAHAQGLSQGSVVLGPTFVGVSAEVVFHAQERSLRSLRDYGELVKSSEDIVVEGDEGEEVVASSGAGFEAEEEFIRLPEKQYIEESKQATGGKRSRDETPAATTTVSIKKTSENPSKKQKKGGK
eukprot:gene1074-780_t